MRKDLCWQFHGKVWDKLDLIDHAVLTINLLNLSTFTIFSMLSSFPPIHPHSFPTILCKYIEYIRCIDKVLFLFNFILASSYRSFFLYRTIFLKLTYVSCIWFLSNSPYSLLGNPVQNIFGLWYSSEIPLPHPPFLTIFTDWFFTLSFFKILKICLYPISLLKVLY